MTALNSARPSPTHQLDKKVGDAEVLARSAADVPVAVHDAVLQFAVFRPIAVLALCVIATLRFASGAAHLLNVRAVAVLRYDCGAFQSLTNVDKAAGIGA